LTGAVSVVRTLEQFSFQAASKNVQWLGRLHCPWIARQLKNMLWRASLKLSTHFLSSMSPFHARWDSVTAWLLPQSQASDRCLRWCLPNDPCGSINTIAQPREHPLPHTVYLVDAASLLQLKGSDYAHQHLCTLFSRCAINWRGHESPGHMKISKVFPLVLHALSFFLGPPAALLLRLHHQESRQVPGDCNLFPPER